MGARSVLGCEELDCEELDCDEMGTLAAAFSARRAEEENNPPNQDIPAIPGSA
jgi:hypothetical protein